MTGRTQRRLAILGAAVALGVFVAANVHLVSAAFRSQPECVIVEDAAVPARRAC